MELCELEERIWNGLQELGCHKRMAHNIMKEKKEKTCVVHCIGTTYFFLLYTGQQIIFSLSESVASLMKTTLRDYHLVGGSSKQPEKRETILI